MGSSRPRLKMRGQTRAKCRKPSLPPEGEREINSDKHTGWLQEYAGRCECQTQREAEKEEGKLYFCLLVTHGNGCLPTFPAHRGLTHTVYHLNDLRHLTQLIAKEDFFKPMTERRKSAFLNGTVLYSFLLQPGRQGEWKERDNLISKCKSDYLFSGTTLKTREIMPEINKVISFIPFLLLLLPQGSVWWSD